MGEAMCLQVHNVPLLVRGNRYDVCSASRVRDAQAEMKMLISYSTSSGTARRI